MTTRALTMPRSIHPSVRHARDLLRNTLMLATSLVGLLGCNATAIKQPSASMTDDPTVACLGVLHTDPRLLILSDRLGPFDGMPKPTLEMMSSKEVPTLAEKTALSLWIAGRQDCVERGAVFRKIHAPLQYQGVIEDYSAALAIAASKLYAGDIAYGQFIAERQRIASTAQSRWSQARQTEHRDIIAAQKDEAEARAKMASDLAQALSKLQPAVAPQSLPQPLRCTTRRIENTSYTDCL